MNQLFKRYRLVDEDESNRIKEKQIRDYDPDLNAETRKRSRIDDVIDDPKLNPELKLRLIQHLSHSIDARRIQPDTKLKTVTLQIEQPHIKTQLPVPITEEVAAEPTAHKPHQDDMWDMSDPEERTTRANIFENVVDLVPVATRHKASDLVEIINKHPNIIDVNKANEFVIDGKRIVHSDVIHTFRYLYNPGNIQEVPVGYNRILQTFAKLNVPLRLISNRVAKQLITDYLQNGNGKSFKNPKLKRNLPIRKPKLTHNPKKPIGFAKKDNSFKSLKLWKI